MKYSLLLCLSLALLSTHHLFTYDPELKEHELLIRAANKEKKLKQNKVLRRINQLRKIDNQKPMKPSAFKKRIKDIAHQRSQKTMAQLSKRRYATMHVNPLYKASDDDEYSDSEVSASELDPSIIAALGKEEAKRAFKTAKRAKENHIIHVVLTNTGRAVRARKLERRKGFSNMSHILKR